MADISKIKLPSSETAYDVKDNSAVASMSISGRTITYTKRGGSTGTVTLPEDQNTDTKVTQGYSTGNSSYPLLMSATAGVSSTASRGATMSIVTNTVYANPSTGTLYADGITTVSPAKSVVNVPSNGVVASGPTQMYQSPVPKYLWHDLFAFCRQCGTPKYYTTTNNSTWTEATVNKNLFACKENQAVNVVAATGKTGSRWLWTSGIAWCSASWLVIGSTYSATPADLTVTVDVYFSDTETWTTIHQSTNALGAQPYWFKLGAINGASQLRLTVTKPTSDTTKTGQFASIKLLTTRWGDQGAGSEMEYPYTWDADANIFPIANGTKYLGSSTAKWATVYATTFNGNLTGNASGTATNVTGTVALANGGTGATTAAGARTNLGIPFAFGVTADGKYGYYKDGETTVTPFKNPAGSINITSNGSHDVTDYATATVNVQPALQEKTVSPTESSQSVTPDSGKYGLSKVTVNAISSTYVGSGVARKASSDMTGTWNAQLKQYAVTAPAGYYASNAQYNTSPATITASATKGTVSNNSITVTPKYTASAAGGYVPPNVTANGTAVTVSASELVSGTKTINSNVTDEDVTNYQKVTVNVSAPTANLQDNKTVSPTESQQTVNPDTGYDGLKKVTVNAISSTYVGSGVAKKSSTDLTVSGATVTAPAGYYSAAASKSVATGTAGTPSASKGTVSNNQISITPTVTNTTGYITGGTKNGTAVTVKASELVSGTATITKNGTSDVTNYKNVSVDVKPTLMTETVTPTEESQIVASLDDYSGYKSVTVEGIDPTYVGSEVPRKASSDMTAAYNESAGKYTVTAPAGYYASAGTKDISTGVISKPMGKKGTVTNNAIDVTPYLIATTDSGSEITLNGDPVTVAASELVSGSQTVRANGTYDVTNLASFIVDFPTGGLPAGISAFDFGTYTKSSASTTTAFTVSHNLGVVPDLVIFYTPTNIATTYSMLMAMRGSVVNWRSGYNSHYAYHGNSTSTVTWANSNNANYGVGSMTATSFKVASHSTSYYWRAGTYKYIALKFS